MDKPTKKLYSDEELIQLEKNDLYEFQRSLRQWALTGVFILALFIFCLFIYRAVSDDSFRIKVTDTILANLSGIIFFMLALIGFNVNNKKQS